MQVHAIRNIFLIISVDMFITYSDGLKGADEPLESSSREAKQHNVEGIYFYYFRSVFLSFVPLTGMQSGTKITIM